MSVLNKLSLSESIETSTHGGNLQDVVTKIIVLSNLIKKFFFHIYAVTLHSNKT